MPEPEPDVLSGGAPDDEPTRSRPARAVRRWLGRLARFEARLPAVGGVSPAVRRTGAAALVVLVVLLAYLHGQSGGGSTAAGDREGTAPAAVNPRQPSFTGADARTGRDLVVTVADTYAAVVDARVGRELRLQSAIPANAYAESALTMPGHLLVVVAGEVGLEVRLVDLSSGQVIERFAADDVADGLPGRSPWIESFGKWQRMLYDDDGDADDIAVKLRPGEQMVREIDAGLLTLAPADDAGATSTRLILRSSLDGGFLRDLTGPGQLIATTRGGAVWLPRGRAQRVEYVDGSGRISPLRLHRPLLSLAAATSPTGGRVALLTGTSRHPYLTVAYLPTEPGAPHRVYFGAVRGSPPYHLAFAPDGDAVYFTADRALWRWRSGGPPLRLMTLQHTPVALLPF